MRTIIAIALALAFSGAQAAQTYFGVYGVGESDSVQSCSGDCPVTARDRLTPFGFTVGAMSSGQLQLGGEFMIGEEPALLAKARYNLGPWGLEFGAGKQSQYIDIQNQTPGAVSMYDRVRDTGNIYLVGVSYGNFVVSYMRSEADHGANGYIPSTPRNIGLHAGVKTRKEYVRIEYRFNF